MPPSELFGTGYASDGVTISLQRDQLSKLDPAEADAGSGDGRRIFRGIVEAAHNNYSNLPGSVPYLTINKANPVGIGPNRIRVTYTISFEQDIIDSEVASDS